MIGPIPHPPFPFFASAHWASQPENTEGKKSIIIDLSMPHGSYIPSINGLIPSGPCHFSLSKSCQFTLTSGTCLESSEKMPII